MGFVGFVDTTLRDGAQSPLLFDTHKYQFDLEDKKKIVEGLIRLGVRRIEFFSPVVSRKERADFIKIKKMIEGLAISEKVMMLCHCRCVKEDIVEAVKVGADGLNLYMGLSDLASKNYGKSLEEISKIALETVSWVRKKYPKLYLRISGEDAFRTPLKRFLGVTDKFVGLVDGLGIPDTTGVANPELVTKRVKLFKKRYPKIDLECHFHNDRGLSVANALAAAKAGAEYIDVSVWGMAERSGITSVTALLLNLFIEKEEWVKRFNLELCYPVNVLMGSILHWHVPYTEPVSLTNRTHIAGVHQKAVMGQSRTYEAHSLGRFGVSRDQLLLGPLTGWNFVYYYLREIENFIISIDEAKLITEDYKREVGREIKKGVKPEEFLVELADKHKLFRFRVLPKYDKRRLERLD